MFLSGCNWCIPDTAQLQHLVEECLEESEPVALLFEINDPQVLELHSAWCAQQHKEASVTSSALDNSHQVPPYQVVADLQQEVMSIKQEVIESKEDLLVAKDKIIESKDELLAAKQRVIESQDELLTAKQEANESQQEVVELRQEVVELQRRLLATSHRDAPASTAVASLPPMFDDGVDRSVPPFATPPSEQGRVGMSPADVCNKQNCAVNNNNVDAALFARFASAATASSDASLSSIEAQHEQGRDDAMPSVEPDVNDDNVISLSSHAVVAPACDDGPTVDSSDLDLDDMLHDGVPEDLLLLASHHDQQIRDAMTDIRSACANDTNSF